MSGKCTLLPLAAFALLVAATAPSFGQSTSATIRGTVKDETGGLPGATHRGPGDRRRLLFRQPPRKPTAASGSRACDPGPTSITVTMDQYKPAARRLQVLVGQDIDLDFRLTADLVYAENVTVVGELAIDIKTAQIATHITSEQIRDLPTERPELPELRRPRPGRARERRARRPPRR